MTGPERQIRPYVQAWDDGLILSSWARHVRTLHPFCHWDGEEFAAHMRRMAARLKSCTALIACSPDCPQQGFGYVVAELHGAKQVLHFVYVRHTFRRLGIGTALMGAVFPRLGVERIYHTHPAAAVHHHRERWMLRFNPYL